MGGSESFFLFFNVAVVLLLVLLLIYGFRRSQKAEAGRKHRDGGVERDDAV